MCSFLFFLLHPLFFLLSRKVSHFTLSHIWRYTGVQERSLGFARDDDMGKTTFQTCPLYEAKDIHSTFVRLRPPSRHFERSREILLALCSSLPLSRKASNFTLSHIRRYTGVQERSRASLGMTIQEYRSLTLPIYFPCNNDTREAPSTFASLLCFYAPHRTPEPANLKFESRDEWLVTCDWWQVTGG